MSLPWIKKYEPKKTDEIFGQDLALKNLKNYIKNYKSQKKKGLIIYGPPGTGKTTSVYAIASELNLEVIEVNASDFRNKGAINSIIGIASKQMSLFAKSKVILVDEIDGLSGTKDRGGIPALAALVTNTSFPMIMTAFDPYDKKFSALRSKCETVGFDMLAYSDIFKKLELICKKENVEFVEIALKSLARRAGGDMRAAINDLQTLVYDTNSLTKEDLENLSDREGVELISDALLKVFKSTNANVALSAFDYVNEDFDQIRLWLDENLPKEYKNPMDLARAYDKLSRSDLFSRRIRRWQHWRFMVYIKALMSAGVAVSKDEKNREQVSYKQSDRILKIWIANQKYAKRKAIAEKISDKTHSSSKVALKYSYPYIKKIFEKNPTHAEKLTVFFDFNNDEVAWLKKRY